MMNVLSCIVPTRNCSPDTLFRLASWCNRWAKQVDRATQQSLYALKGDLLQRLCQDHADQIAIRGDTDRNRGLLSVGLCSAPRTRLHTHEYWMRTESP
jgi:hypothetical protein